jgi:hypothetical protein
MRCFFTGRGRAPGTPAFAPRAGACIAPPCPFDDAPCTELPTLSSSSRFIPLFSAAGSAAIVVPVFGVVGCVDAGRVGSDSGCRSVPGPGVPVCIAGGLPPACGIFGLEPGVADATEVGGGKVVEVGVGTPGEFPGAPALASFLSSFFFFLSSRACCDWPTSAVGFHYNEISTRTEAVTGKRTPCNPVRLTENASRCVRRSNG